MGIMGKKRKGERKAMKKSEIQWKIKKEREELLKNNRNVPLETNGEKANGNTNERWKKTNK